MNQPIRIGMDTSKRLFQLHGVDAGERVVLRRQLRRDHLLAFFAELPPALVALEACGAAHDWARRLTALGHDVRLIAPQLAKPYVSRGKNDAADAAALCEAASRPRMRFVPVKSADEQAALMLAGQRARLVRQRVQLANTIRGHAGEFGLVAAKGAAAIRPLLARLAEADIPDLARALFAELEAEYADLCGYIAALETRLWAWSADSEPLQCLRAIPGVGPLIAALLVMKTPDPHRFACARDYAAWLGLTPRDHSTAGRQRLGCITRAGDPMLRSLLVVGATAIVWRARRPAKAGAYGPEAGPHAALYGWVRALLARKPAKLVAVALANKLARIAWVLLARGQRYGERDRAAALTPPQTATA
ncbi:MAG: IS110 family transposase [Actinomycetospora chiangmaiensis]|nr:IS110 family transposase [Actinomycetospora chiangmaiensis]